MYGIRFLSIAEQVAGHLRGELKQGRWSGLMPGKHQLSEELGVNNKTVEAALRQLETEGLLVAQGAGRRRKIVMPGKVVKPTALRVAILVGEAAERRLDYMVELQHELAEAGHRAFYTSKAMLDLGMDVKRIARMVAKTEADAWVVVSGSHEVLQWFAGRRKPVFALFGRRRELPIAGAGPDKPPILAAAVRELIGLGHRRIVLLARPRRRLPEPGASEQAFLDELLAHGIEPGPYHLPDWEESIEGFDACLDSLFQLTPPTALIIEEVPLFTAAYHFLARRGLRVPEDVSVVCTDASPDFDWCRVSVAHIRWDSRPVVRRILRWAENVSHGKADLRQTFTPAEFVRGGTIGPMGGSQ